MQVSRETWIAIAIGSAVVLVGSAIYGLSTGGPTAIPAVQPWNQRPIRALQGIPITISVPRGESFLVASPDIMLQAQVQRGNDTHLVIVPLVTGEAAYTLETVIVDRTTNRTYPIELHVRPIESYVERNPEAIG
jgi:hypothetical protein